MATDSSDSHLNSLPGICQSDSEGARHFLRRKILVRREVIAEKEAEIEEIHERYMIGSRYKRSVQDKDAVLQAIARDYLSIPNWQEATYMN
jgi:hypothetical protein